MSITSSINIQMADFISHIQIFERNFDTIYKTTQDIFTDLNDAKNSLNEAVATSNENQENIEEYTNKIFDSVFKECDAILMSSKKLNQSLAEVKHFNSIEQEFRRNFENNPLEFRENDFKEMLTAKPNHIPTNPHIEQLKTLIESAKSGGSLAEDDDLVVGEASQAPKKCPITGKQIKVECKNLNCNHVYEREAVIAYMRGKRQVKCPYAGCSKYLSIE